MNRLTAFLTSAATLFVAAPAFAQPRENPKALESAFDSQISAADQVNWLQQMTSAVNNVGSPHDKANAEMELALFKQWGWNAHIEQFDVLYPTPISTTLELIAPEHVTLGGQEPPVAQDPTSTSANALPPYLIYAADGDVTAPVVYVNYGMPDDYTALERRGISVKGKIVLARYGAGWRGLKPLLAQQHGAAACLIYSDPADDGYAEADPYPAGGGRPPFGIQRGSVEDMTAYPGDPLTPNVGSTPGAKRLSLAEAKPLLKIPALPISYADATKILSALQGPVVTGDERGALGMPYHWGTTDAVKVHLAVKSDWSNKPVFDVIAMLPGSVYPDQWVVRGNHHDGWVIGAADPLTGQVALMDEAKALGALYRQGWRPKRTIVYASWDGEEPGLLGSTEWAEQHADELKRKAVLYVNTDNNDRGFLGADGNGELQSLITGVAADVRDPQTGVSVLDRDKAHILTAHYTDADSVEKADLDAAKKDEIPLGPLGSGSDYSSFAQHLGVPALDLSFGGEGESDGSYHSLYDSFYHVMHFDDPGLAYGAALSKVVGRVVLRAADASRFPAHYSDFADGVARYVDEVQKLANDQREKDRTLADLRRDQDFKLASSPTDPTTAPPDKGITPLIDMLPLQNASDHLTRAAAAADDVLADESSLPPATQAQINGLLTNIDQLLLDPKGLPGRPWYQNLISAPGTLTGYGAKTLPGIREGIEQRRFDDAREYVGRTARAIDAYASRLDQVAALGGRPPS